MSVKTQKIINGTYLSVASTVLYTAGVGEQSVINQCTIFNSDVASQTVTIHLVESGASATDDKAIVKAFAIGAGKTEIMSELIGHTIETGGTIRANASIAAKIAMQVSATVRV